MSIFILLIISHFDWPQLEAYDSRISGTDEGKFKVNSACKERKEASLTLTFLVQSTVDFGDDAGVTRNYECWSFSSSVPRGTSWYCI